MKIDLNAPAFGQNAQKVSELDSKETVVEEIKPVVEETIETSEEESKVPYSRFKKFHDAAKEAEEQAAYWKAKATAIETESQPQTEDLPAAWMKLYGNSEESKEAWKIQQDFNKQLREDALKEAREAVRNERFEETERQEQNIETLDSNFEELADSIGRELTEAEQSVLLDAVDFLTPKDRQGNYAGPLVSFEAAWDYAQAKQNISKSARIQTRDQVASLSGSQSQGEPSLTEKQERDKNFNPFAWDSYKSRL